MKSEKKNRIRSMFGARFRAGSYSAFASAIVIIIAIIVNLAVGSLPTTSTQFDLTSNSIYTLSDQTKKICNSLNKDVNLYLLANSGSEDETITRLLDRYAALSSHIKVSYVDPNQQPTFLNSYELSTSRLYANSVLVDCDGRYRLVGYDSIYVTSYSMNYSTYSYDTSTTFDGENALTNAIHYVSSDNLPKVYTLTGHGESELSDEVTEMLEQDNFETESLSLMTLENVPEDATAVIINVPTSDLNEDEAKMLITYVQNGGSIALTTDYIDEGKMTNLLSVTSAMGLTVQNGLVVEGDSEHYYPRYPHYLLPEIASHDITDAIIDGNYYILVPVAQGIVEADGSSADVTWLLTTTESAYTKASGLNTKTTAKEDGDTEGAFHVGAVSELNGGKLFWVTSADFLNDSVNQVVSGANYDLYLNALNWMGGQEDSISIRSKSLDNETLTVSSAASTRWSIIMIGVIPLTLIVIGIVIWVRRKRR